LTLLVAVFQFEANLQLLWIQPHNYSPFWESNPVFYFVSDLSKDFEFFFLEGIRIINPITKITTPIIVGMKYMPPRPPPGNCNP